MGFPNIDCHMTGRINWTEIIILTILFNLGKIPTEIMEHDKTVSATQAERETSSPSKIYIVGYFIYFIVYLT